MKNIFKNRYGNTCKLQENGLVQVKGTIPVFDEEMDWEIEVKPHESSDVNKEVLLDDFKQKVLRELRMLSRECRRM